MTSRAPCTGRLVPLATPWDVPFLGLLVAASLALGALADRRGGVPSGVSVRTPAGRSQRSLAPGAFEVEGALGLCTLEVDARGAVRFLAAPCPYGLCQTLAPARRAGDAVVCVPSQVLVELTGPRADGLDGVTR